MKNKYPVINYIGNKEKVAKWIVDHFPIKSGKVLDLFCGGCSVSYYLKLKGFDVVCNDILFSSYVLAKAIVQNKKNKIKTSDYNFNIPTSSINKKYKEIKFLSNKIYFDHEVRELAWLLCCSEKMNGFKKFMFLALLRRAMIRKLPYSRMNVAWSEIKKFRDEVYSYKKYGRYRHYHNVSFKTHIDENIPQFNNAIINNKSRVTVLNSDAIDCIHQIKKVDLIYMDPPYPSTMNNYWSFYGPYDVIFRRQQKNKTNLVSRNNFILNFQKIIIESRKKTKYVAISLSNHSYPSVKTVVLLVQKYISWFKIYKTKHIYKVTGKKNKNQNYEILLVIKFNNK